MGSNIGLFDPIFFLRMGNAIKVGNIDTAFGDCKTTLGLWI
ncbi:hypothetical protein [Photorhabdus akhurstii]|nr:hypothetical protein [Photorhabdus akhurstii]